MPLGGSFSTLFWHEETINVILSSNFLFFTATMKFASYGVSNEPRNVLLAQLTNLGFSLWGLPDKECNPSLYAFFSSLQSSFYYWVQECRSCTHVTRCRIYSIDNLLGYFVQQPSGHLDLSLSTNIVKHFHSSTPIVR